MRVISLPLWTRAPMTGLVRITSPCVTSLLRTPWPMRTVKPRFCSSSRAVAFAIPATGGIVLNRPVVIHQVTRPTTMTTASAPAR